MFNQPADKPRQPNYDGDPSTFAFANQPWPRFGINTSAALSNDPSQSSHVSRRSYGSSAGMDWTPTPSAAHTHFDQHQFHENPPPPDNVELDDLHPPPGGGGVGRLIAQFENKNFVPPLPPRPSNSVTRHEVAPSPVVQSPFGNFDAAVSSFASPVASPIENHYGSQMGEQQRMASPFASPPPMAFGGFQDISRLASPVADPSSEPFGSMDQFMTHNRMSTPMVNTPVITSPPPTTPAVPGTPGFAIWRPPVPMTPKPVMSQSHFSTNSNNNSSSNNNNASNSGGYFRPPVPSTPKPAMNAGNQFILELNPGASKAKGKAPAKPPLRQPPRQASRQQLSMSMASTSSPSIKQEPGTPQVTQALPSSPAPTTAERRGSMSVRQQAGTRPSREQVPAEAWDSFKTTIRSLYLEERRPLKEVMSIMAEKYGFTATPKMYKTRFSQWGFVKNNTEDEVKRLLSMKFQRDAEGKVSEFVRNGKVVNLGTYLKRKGVTEYDLVDFETPADLPAHIRCRTPTPPPAPGYLGSPDLIRAQETVVGNMRKAFLHCRQFESETDAHIGWQTVMVWGAGSSDLLLEANHYFEMRDADQGGHFLMMAFKQLEVDLKKLSPQTIKELLLGMVHRDPGMITALCKYLAAYATTNFERAHPLRQIFTCLYEVQQKHGSVTLSDLLWGSIPIIAEELEAIYGRRHPYVARTWIDLALFYNHVNPEQLGKLVDELRLLQRQMEHRQGHDSVDVLTLRYSIVQLMYATNPQSEETKHAVADLFNHVKRLGLLFAIRDPRPNVYCYHSPVKVDPWTKRCRRRYDLGVRMLEEILGVHMVPYFEEDFHTTEHMTEHAPCAASGPSAQDSWAAAVEHLGTSKWSFI